MIWRCAGDFFKVLLKFKVAATDQKICLVNFFLNFNITFPATWGCANDYFEDAIKFQNGRQRSTPKLKFRKFYFYFFCRRGFIHFKVKKKMKTVSFLLCECKKQSLLSLEAKLTRCGQSDTTQRAARCRNQV